MQVILKKPVEFYSFLVGLLTLLIVSCDQKDNAIEMPVSKPCLVSFSFLKDNNPQLEEDVFCDISIERDTINCFVPHLITESLVASFSGDFSIVTVRDEIQVSGVSVQDFNHPITYVFTDDKGNTIKKVLCVRGYNGIPRIVINTEGNNPITSKEEYVNAGVKISNCPSYGVLETNCKIRGRGNATWNDYPKKPYKLKFETKQGLFGFPANKDWVLLAEYCDKSFLRTAYMCEVSRAVGIEYTVNYQYVELLLNGDYKGLYILTDQVERAKNRVDIEDDGFLIEDDGYYDKEPLFFTTELMCNNYTFKYPSADKAKIVDGDENYVFIKEFVDGMEKALQAIPNDCELYKEYVDIESFAKWYVAAEVTGNWEPNLFYVLPSRGERLKMLPMWDAEWSLGLASKGNDKNPNGWFVHPHESQYDIHIWNNRKYFQYLFKDPDFVSEVQRVWNIFAEKIEDVNVAIASRREEIRFAQKSNFEKWPILGKFIAVGLVAFSTWEEETDYTSSFFENRVIWLNQELDVSTTENSPTRQSIHREFIP